MTPELTDLEIENLKIDKEDKKKRKKFDFEETVFKFRFPLLFLLGGLILIGFGILIFKNAGIGDSSKIEVIESVKEGQEGNSEIVVEISGAVEKPGVYKLAAGARVEDLLIAAGGISADANREWMEKFINRAAKLSDGQKIYIAKQGEEVKSASGQSAGTSTQEGGIRGLGGFVNINTSSQSELEDLPGIGPVYAQSIIEHRPYSSVEELLSKGALKKHVYEKVKDKVSVY